MSVDTKTVPTLSYKYLGQGQEYTSIWQDMQTFTENRTAACHDQLWLLEHAAVFTLGRAGRREHILNISDTPIVQSDRGGQVTWHGPGQIVAYPLLNLNRLNISIRALVSMLEDTVIELLSSYGISAQSQSKAPGVYVDEAKIAAVGLRIRRGCSYHGLSLNVCNDLAPFKQINPCGYAGLKVTNMARLSPDIDLKTVNQRLLDCFIEKFGYHPLVTGRPH